MANKKQEAYQPDEKTGLWPHEYDYAAEQPYVGGFPYGEEITAQVYKRYKDTSDEATWKQLKPLFDEGLQKYQENQEKVEAVPSTQAPAEKTSSAPTSASAKKEK